MPLTTCPACGKDISTTATSCPACGHLIKVGRESAFNALGVLITIFLVGVAIILIVGAIGGIASEAPILIFLAVAAFVGYIAYISFSPKPTSKRDELIAIKNMTGEDRDRATEKHLIREYKRVENRSQDFKKIVISNASSKLRIPKAKAVSILKEAKCRGVPNIE